jgi:hypothetical protein
MNTFISFTSWYKKSSNDIKYVEQEIESQVPRVKTFEREIKESIQKPFAANYTTSRLACYIMAFVHRRGLKSRLLSFWNKYGIKT